MVFVAVYQKTLSLMYVDELLQRVKDEFILNYKPRCADLIGLCLGDGRLRHCGAVLDSITGSRV